ncbi:Hsp20/alpha crystallin family protein [Streptomyces sp. NPDC056883]|uniref:Hsp20/alpha crystallin family protein n=1 Tax=Streptomyces sp. NPDC056883 TaxID=3345959 RepID=UPI0036B0045E
MLMRTDPFREIDRVVQQLSGTSGTWSKPSVMPMDAYRQGDEYVIAFDLPGVNPGAIDIDVERNMLTVKAERRPTGKSDNVQMELCEQPLGVFSRQVHQQIFLFDPTGDYPMRLPAHSMITPALRTTRAHLCARCASGAG